MSSPVADRLLRKTEIREPATVCRRGSRMLVGMILRHGDRDDACGEITTASGSATGRAACLLAPDLDRQRLDVAGVAGAADRSGAQMVQAHGDADQVLLRR